MREPPQVIVRHYPFNRDTLETLQAHQHAQGHWPLVYILSDAKTSKAYVGETTDAISRLSTHLRDDDKQKLATAHLVSSDQFNKSATLDIESALIQYMSADGRFELLNANLGLVNHNYYQKAELYRAIFKKTWDQLHSQGLVQRSLESIDNSDVFKYSPYKSLSFDQRLGLIGILGALLDNDLKTLLVEGGAGTGKSVLAIFLFKLLHSDLDELRLREFSDEELELRDYLLRFKQQCPTPKMALVVPMSSFRNTLKKAFRKIAGLSPKMVIGPAELALQHYDIVLVDESHRLRKRKNLGSYFNRFDAVSQQLGFDRETCSEVDWVLARSDKAVFFYDRNQSIKPSDADAEVFEKLRRLPSTQQQTLLSQFRVKAGSSYAAFIANLLSAELPANDVFRSKHYEFELFEHIEDMIQTVRARESQHELARLVAGYSWPWNSKKNPEAFDIVIENTQLRWNKTNNDWINSNDSISEVGCIHTTQGYDLNYAGIIFGNEIRFDPEQQQIVIDAQNYFDKAGKQSITDPEQLKQYILNIYQTILMRGIKGTFVYACDPHLRHYLKQHIPVHQKASEAGIDNALALQPFVNSVPLYDLAVAAGDFSAQQTTETTQWVPVPPDMAIDDNHYACQVVGESMNRVIPNGATCLFRKDRGGTRNGKIVLVEMLNSTDPESGHSYTIKEYQSTKFEDHTGLLQRTISLKPRSDDPSFKPIELDANDSAEYRVVGEFVRVLD